MAEKQGFATILKCAICKKEGIAHIHQGVNVESFLNGDSHESGFKYGPIGGGGEWHVACHECFYKSEVLMDKQELERENFLKGE